VVVVRGGICGTKSTDNTHKTAFGTDDIHPRYLTVFRWGFRLEGLVHQPLRSRSTPKGKSQLGDTAYARISEPFCCISGGWYDDAVGLVVIRIIGQLKCSKSLLNHSNFGTAQEELGWWCNYREKVEEKGFRGTRIKINRTRLANRWLVTWNHVEDY